MKAMNALVLPLLATAGLALALDADAQNRPGGPGYGSGNRGSGSGNWHGRDGRRDWGSHGHYYGHRHYGYRHYGWSWLWAAPLFLGGYNYYGYPYYYGYWGPRYYGDWGPRYYSYRSPTASYPEDYDSAAYSRPINERPIPTTEVAPTQEGAPTERPLYLNYCESAKAYYPKVTTCPGGWQMRRPQY